MGEYWWIERKKFVRFLLGKDILFFVLMMFLDIYLVSKNVLRSIELV